MATPYPKPEFRERKKRGYLKRRTAKQSADDRKYTKDAKVFLDGKHCAVYGNIQATEVHHMKGRIGFADQWAKDRNIRLIHDQRFWLPTSRQGHQKIELNPGWAKENGYTLTRTDILI